MENCIILEAFRRGVITGIRQLSIISTNLYISQKLFLYIKRRIIMSFSTEWVIRYLVSVCIACVLFAIPFMIEVLVLRYFFR